MPEGFARLLLRGFYCLELRSGSKRSAIASSNLRAPSAKKPQPLGASRTIQEITNPALGNTPPPASPTSRPALTASPSPRPAPFIDAIRAREENRRAVKGGTSGLLRKRGFSKAKTGRSVESSAGRRKAARPRSVFDLRAKGNHPVARRSRSRSADWSIGGKRPKCCWRRRTDREKSLLEAAMVCQTPQSGSKVHKIEDLVNRRRHSNWKL